MKVPLVVFGSAIALQACALFPPLAGVSDADLRLAAPTIAVSETLLFRGRGNVRINDLFGAIAGSEILITDQTVAAMTGGGRSGREPISAFSFKRATVAKALDAHLSFIEVQLKDGQRHFLDIPGGRKAEVLKLLRG